MIKNYFKIGLRNLWRHKSYTAINVIGLTVGLAAFLLINQYVQYERSYDGFHKEPDQLYRLTTDMIVDGQLKTRDAMSFNPSGKVIADEFPEVEEFSVTYNNGQLSLRKGESLIRETSVKMADEHFVELFGYEVIAGDQATMLLEPYSIVLTQKRAQFYFGDENPIGQTLHVHSGFDREFEVTGVIADVPGNTHFKFDLLVSISSIQQRLDREGWNAFNYYTYLRLKPGTDSDELEQRLIPLKNTHMGEKNLLFFNLQPIQEIHLYSDMTYEPEATGSARSVRFLEIISIFILVIAWVNYINLSTAKAVDRAREVGLRKVIGAAKSQIRIQFLFESLLINLMGGSLAFILAVLAVPFFNQLVGEGILSSLYNNSSFLSNLFIFMLTGTIVSGFYPAVFLSNFGIVTVLKGKFRTSKRGVMLRKSLVVAQFATSFILIGGTFIVVKQVEFMRSANLGMNTEQVLGFRNPRFVGDDYEAQRAQMRSFQNALLRNPLIKQVATTNSLPGGASNDIGSTSGQSRIVGITHDLEATTYIHQIDDQYFDLLEVEFLVGRNFDGNLQSDSSAVVVNESFVKRYEIPVSDELLNEKIRFGTNPESDKYHIVGIIRDANRGSLKSPVEPTCYFYDPVLSRSIIKLSGTSVRESMDHLEVVWSEFFPNSVLEYSFINERFDRLYADDKKFGSVFGAFSGFALLVAILGLFGLSSFMAAQRTKEVGVRKVLGASIPHIIMLFYREFISLIVISFVIGLPVIFFTMNGWLDNYAFRIDFPWVFVIVALGVIVCCAFVTVGYQVWRIAVLDPAKTLKYE